jgi:hypothetical protein
MIDPPEHAPHPPLIIMGMHRSGTSLLCRLLQRLGLFAGWDTGRTAESLFFRRTNDWVLKCAGASWDNPTGWRELPDNPLGYQAVKEAVAARVTGFRMGQYLGPLRTLRSIGGSPVDRPWGWKDPRNTITLPLWLDIFPNARVVAVERHGIDVAASLATREAAALHRARLFWGRSGLGKAILPGYAGRGRSVRCARVGGAFALWTEYTAAAREWIGTYGERQIMAVRFEDLVREPVDLLERIASFAGLSCDRARITKAAGGIDRHAAFRYRRNEELAALAESWCDELRRYGY